MAFESRSISVGHTLGKCGCHTEAAQTRAQVACVFLRRYRIGKPNEQDTSHSIALISETAVPLIFCLYRDGQSMSEPSCSRYSSRTVGFDTMAGVSCLKLNDRSWLDIGWPAGAELFMKVLHLAAPIPRILNCSSP